jgi:death-on-curing protein
MIEYLTLEELLAIHSSMVKRFGGLAGIRDKNLLHSVVELPKSTMFGEDLYSGVFEKAAIYLFSIVRKPPF